MSLINTTRFFRNCYFRCGSSHMYCDSVGPFPQSAFRQCYRGWGSNRLCLKNSLRGEVNPHLYTYIIVGILSHALIFYFIIWLLRGSLESHQSSLLSMLMLILSVFVKNLRIFLKILIDWASGIIEIKWKVLLLLILKLIPYLTRHLSNCNEKKIIKILSSDIWILIL